MNMLTTNLERLPLDRSLAELVDMLDAANADPRAFARRQPGLAVTERRAPVVELDANAALTECARRGNVSASRRRARGQCPARRRR